MPPCSAEQSTGEWHIAQTGARVASEQQSKHKIKDILVPTAEFAVTYEKKVS